MTNRFCRIVATLGPATDAPSQLLRLVQTGVDAVRFNFSHGEHEHHLRRLEAVRAVEAEVGRPIAVIADLQGPKIRVGDLPDAGVTLRYDKEVTLRLASSVKDVGDACIPIPHPELFEALEPGDVLKLDDGAMQLTVISIDGEEGRATVDVGGQLASRKGVNVPTRRLPLSALTDKDREDLAFALDKGFDYIALSFVQRPGDVQEARRLAHGRARIIAKIEKPQALNELAEIITLSDAVMVARGDLGVELPLEQVPVAQRNIISAARKAGKPVIVATQMLQSMVEASTPTRAEASDIATAVYLGADAVMLSAETAVGRHPLTAVAIMDRVIRSVETDELYWTGVAASAETPPANETAAIAVSARQVVGLLSCDAVLAYTSTGATVFSVARERPACPILAITPVAATARAAMLAWGVDCRVIDDMETFEELAGRAASMALDAGVAEEGGRIVLIAGMPLGKLEGTNVLRIVDVA